MPFLSSETFGDLGKAVGDIGGGIADIFQGQGAGIEQQAYTQAAAFAGQEAQYEQMSTAIQTTQAKRETLLGHELMAEAAGKAASADTLGSIGKFVGAGLNLIAGGVSAASPAPAFASNTAIY